MGNNSHSKRIMALDICRIAACLCVCIEHLFRYAGFRKDIYDIDVFFEHLDQGYFFSFLEFGPPLFSWFQEL